MTEISILSRCKEYGSASWPSASLALARFVFGFSMLISCIRFVALGWIEDQYVHPVMHFPYHGFEWVVVPSSAVLYLMYGAMMVLASAIMIGFRSRLSTLLFTLLFTYVELIDKTYYLNHYYFVTVMGLLLCILPIGASWSVDVWLSPKRMRPLVPRWTVDVIKFQIALVYIFAGVAKISHDWLFEALPLSIWLPAHTDLPIIGELLAYRTTAFMFSWFGMIFDCTIPMLLLWRKSRVVAYVAVVVFHTITGMLFQIGVFPVVMILMTLVFFYPPRWMYNKHVDYQSMACRVKSVSVVSRYLIVAFMTIQVMLPLRHLFYRGNILWTEEGYRYSWRVMLMEKSGDATFYVKPRGETGEVVVSNSEFLNIHQEKQMSMQPDMILHYAKFIADHYGKLWGKDVSVRAEVWVTLNGRKSRLLVDPTIDLSQYSDGFLPYAFLKRYCD